MASFVFGRTHPLMLIALMFRFVTRKMAGVAGKLGRESFTSNDMSLSLDLKILARRKFFAKS